MSSRHSFKSKTSFKPMFIIVDLYKFSSVVVSNCPTPAWAGWEERRRKIDLALLSLNDWIYQKTLTIARVRGDVSSKKPKIVHFARSSWSRVFRAAK